ncbi:MAG: GNAT family N-acetyltransferase, partial [Anaerolineae bacterium]|nr:GNAT family N-acetyltransferase [Anaerolineae bacterium]
MRIRIRHFTWEDIEPIARLHRASEAVDHAGRICDAIALLQRWRRPGVVPEECLVAERAGAILGYVHRSHVRGTDQCQIDGVVHPAWRRRGIGRQLLERVAEEARLAGAKALDVRAREDEPGTAAFCQATGFRLARVWYRMWLEPVRVATYLFPPGYSRRTFRPHHDEAAYASVL